MDATKRGWSIEKSPGRGWVVKYDDDIITWRQTRYEAHAAMKALDGAGVRPHDD